MVDEPECLGPEGYCGVNGNEGHVAPCPLAPPLQGPKYTIVLTQEALEAGAMASYNGYRMVRILLEQVTMPRWEEVDDRARAMYRKDTHQALVAALPLCEVHPVEEMEEEQNARGDTGEPPI